MKKLFASVLAVAMVASMASVAFAAAPVKPMKDVSSNAFVTNDDGDVVMNVDASKTNTYIDSKKAEVAYGKTFYYPLLNYASNTLPTGDNYVLVYEADAVRGLTAKPEWSMGKDLVSKVEVAKKKFVTDDEAVSGPNSTTDAGQKYAYFVAVTLKDSTSTSRSDLSGTIKLKKSAYTKNNNVYPAIDDDNVKINVGMSVAYPYPTVDTQNIITKDVQLFAKKSTTVPFGFEESTDTQFDIANNKANTTNSYFTVDTFGQGKILASMSTKFDSDIAAKYPQGNLDFYKGNGATFNKIGELTLAAPAKSFLYVVKADGTLAPQKATYDEYEEAFKFKTRTLGQYVISDVELKLASSEVVVPETSTSVPTIEVTPSVPTVPVNPGTGAIA